MVRPYVRKVGGTAFGGFNYEKLRIAEKIRGGGPSSEGPGSIMRPEATRSLIVKCLKGA